MPKATRDYNFGDKIYLKNVSLNYQEEALLKVLCGQITRSIIDGNSSFSNLNITKLEGGIRVLINYTDHYDEFSIKDGNIYLAIGKIPQFLQKV